jgi:tRNA A37 threonylcarbamoyladenosine synthetase subunit TsaC/SUA5/YrdC
MDEPTLPSRHTRLEDVILTQTDTTVGFLSQSKEKLNHIKGRPPNKPYLINFLDFATLKSFLRIPKNKRKEIRRARKTTYIVKNQAFRVAKLPVNSILFQRYKWFYSTSANKSSKPFSLKFATAHADIIVKNALGLEERQPSKIYKINSRKKLRLR